MTKPTAWMPMYWGDYLRDTSHLTTQQHGAYLLLIAHYWSSGQALPDNDLRLSKIARIPPHLWRRVKPTISAFFKVENGRWHHPRIERELIEAFNRKDAAIARGKRGAEARWNDRASMLAPSVKHSNHSHSHSKTHESENLTGAARDPAPDQTAPGRARAGQVPKVTDSPLAESKARQVTKPETSKERLLRLAIEHRQKTLRTGEP